MDEFYYPPTDQAGTQGLQYDGTGLSHDETFHPLINAPMKGDCPQDLSQPRSYQTFPTKLTGSSSSANIIAAKTTTPPQTQPISFHHLCSVTPIRLLLPRDNEARGKQMEIVLACLLGKNESFQHHARRFAKLCFQAVIFHGQGDRERCSLSIDAAVKAFNATMAGDHTWPMILQTLNKMSFFLGIYGQTALKAQITESLISNLRHHDEGKLFVVKGTLEFVHDTASCDTTKPARNLQKAQAIFQRATEITTKKSPFALCAGYNTGCALLEAGRYEEAIALFALGRANVENAFGPYAFETISWIDTLARAHLRNRDFLTAELLMRETVLARVEEAYARDHAIYWEKRYGIGLFYMQMAENNSRSDKTQEYWAVGELLMYEALRWRASELGPDNPQTTDAHNCLKRYLGLQGKTKEALGLFDRYRQGTIS